MTPAARLSAAIDILDRILGGDPATLTLTNWGRQSRFAGSRDRAAVRDIVYDCLRRKRSYAFPFGAETGRNLVVSHARATVPEWLEMFTGTGFDPDPITAEEHAALDQERALPDPVRLNFPDFLAQELHTSLGADFDPVLNAMLDRAPIDLRVNRMKATLDEAASLLAADDVETQTIPGLETGLRVTANPRRVAQSKAYQRGIVELQDASSQSVALFAEAKPGMDVLDYCAGGGGKSLALYDQIRGDGRIVAHDIAPVRMNDLPSRAARANARVTVAQPGHAALRKGAFDLVFVDAPCSGTGSWRRTPDAKWRMTPRDLDNLDKIQTQILNNAVEYLRPNGALIYATCSLLARENARRVASFIDGDPSYGVEKEVFLTPLSMGDGFYASRIGRR